MIRYPFKILLVEDNVDQLLLTERALKRSASETEVVSVRNGQDCLDRLSHEDFSIVLLDYSLPRINGVEVMKRIKEAGFDVPVIMVTGQGDERVTVEAHEERGLRLHRQRTGIPQHAASLRRDHD